MTTAARVVAGLSTERLQQIDSHLERKYLDAGKISGALILVARRGEIAHLSSLGLMDAERGKRMQDDTIFRIYSMSKPITSVALMSLYEEGRFQLDQPVHDFIPEWEGLGVSASPPSSRGSASSACRQTTSARTRNISAYPKPGDCGHASRRALRGGPGL